MDALHPRAGRRHALQHVCIAAGLVAATFALPGCSTIMEGGNQPVTFRSVPEAATVTVTNRAGEKVHAGSTPATVTLKRGAGYFKAESYTVRFEKEGYQTREVVITGSVNGWYIANLLFGGVIGMLIVDPATGAMYSLSPQVSETLEEVKVSRNGDLTLAMVQDVSPAVLAQARKLEFQP